MLCRGELQLRQGNCCQTARVSGRTISEVVAGHGADCRGLLLVALEHETIIGGGDGILCLECLGGRVIPFTVMVGRGAGCRGLLLEVVAHEPCPWAR